MMDHAKHRSKVECHYKIQLFLIHSSLLKLLAMSIGSGFLRGVQCEACGVVSRQGTFVSTRVVYGLKNFSAYFQFTIPFLYDNIKLVLKAWIDDFTLHSKEKEEILNILERFIVICRKHSFGTSARKTVFYTKSAKRCGQVLGNEGYQLDPQNIEAIKRMKDLINASELCKLVHRYR